MRPTTLTIAAIMLQPMACSFHYKAGHLGALSFVYDDKFARSGTGIL